MSVDQSQNASAARPEVARDRFDLIDQEQLAAQVVAIINAHFQRPTADEKHHILRLAADQIRAAEVLKSARFPG